MPVKGNEFFLMSGFDLLMPLGKAASQIVQIISQSLIGIEDKGNSFRQTATEPAYLFYNLRFWHIPCLSYNRRVEHFLKNLKYFPQTFYCFLRGIKMIRQPNLENNSLTLRDEMALLEARVENRLNGRVLNFQLHFRDGGLVLSGSAHTYYAKQLAQHAVMELANMPIQANEIEVL